MSTFSRDIRHSLRTFARNPGFTAVAVLTLAVALGANTAVFSIMNGVLLRALPYEEPDRIVALSVLLPPIEGQRDRTSFVDSRRLASWPQETATTERLAAYRTQSFTLGGKGAPERLSGTRSGAALFPLLGVPPVLGRVFAPEEEAPGRDRVVILSYDLWQRRFQRSPGVLGQTVALDGFPYTVIGVMPRAFFFPQHGVELWMPLSRHASAPQPSNVVTVEYLPAIARLRTGRSPGQAEAEAQALFLRLGETAAAPEDDLRKGRVHLVRLRDQMVGEVQPALLAMGAAVGLVLVIACINLASLLGARNTAREREIAIRSAVGGSRARLVRQMLTESMVLSGMGGLAGVLVAVWIHRLLPFVVPRKIPRIEEVQLDAPVFLFAFFLTGLTGIIVGLLPALRSTNVSLAASLNGGVAERSLRSRSRSLLVVAEVALTFVLVVAGGLLVRSYLQRVGVELGYEPRRVLTATFELDPTKYLSTNRSAAFFDELLDRLGAHAGVLGAGVVSFAPLAPGFSLMSLTVKGEPLGRSLAVPQLTSPGYLQAMGLQLAGGRWLTTADLARDSRATVVNETFARRYIGGRDPLGREIAVGSTTLEVVGILHDLRTLGIDSPPKAEFFTSYHLAQAVTGQGPERLTLAVRTAGDPAVLLPFLRAQVYRLDPTLALEDVRTMDAKLSASEAEPRFYALLLAAFASIALVLAAAGVYGVLAYSVARQTRAIGVRRALGARQVDILYMVLGRGLRLVAAGIIIGLAAAAATMAVLSHLLFGITTRDPLSYGVAVTALLGVGAIACYQPARRATKVDPVEALRIDG